MTNISKRTLPAKEFAKLHKQLSGIVARLDKRSATFFLDELLGDEERVMITKRLAAVVMYAEANSPYRVAQLLYLSPSTAEKIHQDFENGRYDRTVSMLRKQRENYERFWNTLELVLRAGMPPRGRGRWKSVLGRN